LPYAVLAFLSLLWGSSFLLVKLAARGFEPFGLALGRVGIAAACFIAFALVSGAAWPRGHRLWGRLAAVSIIGQIGPFLLIAEAARLTTSADLALMMGGVPILSFGLSRMFGLGEVWSARAALGLALGFAGVALSIGSPLAVGEAYAHAGWGRALALLAALGYGAGALLSRGASLAIGPRMAATTSLTISTVALLGLDLAFAGPPSIAALARSPPAAFARAPPEAIAALVALGVFNTALGYLIYFRLVATAGATFAALNNYAVPFLGIVLGWAALGEPVAAIAWIGFALVLASVGLTGSAAIGPKRVRALLERGRASAGSQRPALSAERRRGGSDFAREATIAQAPKGTRFALRFLSVPALNPV